jgi:hypothetical protein
MVPKTPAHRAARLPADYAELLAEVRAPIALACACHASGYAGVTLPEPVDTEALGEEGAAEAGPDPDAVQSWESAMRLQSGREKPMVFYRVMNGR